jgi:hypothetical protein
LHRAFTHSGLPHATLWQMEYFADIMCALANAHHLWQDAQAHVLGIDIPDIHVHLARMREFARLHARAPSSLEHELFPVQHAEPSSDHAEVWQCVLDSLPHKYGSNLIDYERVKWTHTFPDDRARQLCLSHYVLLLEFGIASLSDCSNYIYVQATMHPSQRNHLLHCVQISYRNVAIPPGPEAFELHSSGCSCEDGYGANAASSQLTCIQERRCVLPRSGPLPCTLHSQKQAAGSGMHSSIHVHSLRTAGVDESPPEHG